MHACPGSVELEQIADALLTPDRGEPAASTVQWDAHDTLDTAQGAIAYWTVGSGPTVLLVHGWEGWHAQMDAFVAPLLGRGARVVSLDLPAHGESGGVTASPLDCGAAIAALGAHIGPLAGAIGHSGGCPSIAIAMRGGLRVQRVALIATPERWERYVRWFAQEEGVDPERLIDTLRARGVDVASLVLPETASTFDVPALIVHSLDDRTTKIEGAQRVAAAWRGSEFLTVDGLGHMRILKDPAIVDRVAQFITQS
ncbi:MAG TPA: alpha/beta hydrolase [Candidatus Acidoferrum sp.]|nr:alpha/beta hydrolase [Candidatus Acidoferrum sp.]